MNPEKDNNPLIHYRQIVSFYVNIQANPFFELLCKIEWKISPGFNYHYQYWTFGSIRLGSLINYLLFSFWKLLLILFVIRHGILAIQEQDVLASFEELKILMIFFLYCITLCPWS